MKNVPRRWKKSGAILALMLALLALTFPLSQPVPAVADDSMWTPTSSGTGEHLIGVWGSSPSDIFAVGVSGIIIHYDGSTWSPMSSGTTDWLEDVWGSSPSDVFAVGGYGTILHYDGSIWSPMSGTTRHLSGVWGSSPSDVFAVGEGSTSLHYDGSAWSSMSIGTTNARFAVWGSSSSDVFAVGHMGTILHYDGSTWNSMSSGTEQGLYGVWGSSSSDVFAVGYHGTILHYDGSTWSSMSSGTGEQLFGVWGSSSSDVFAVGTSGTILHYDDSTWSSMSSGTSKLLNAVWGSSSSDVFAVGEAGTILHYPAPNNPPDIPSNPSPSDHGTAVSIDIDLSWVGGDPDGDAVTYDVYFEKGDSSPDNLVSNDQSGTGYDPGTLDYDSHYYWKIVARDSKGANTSGPVWDFTTQSRVNNPPNTPSNISPSDGASGLDLTSSLQSAPFSDPDSGDTHAASQWQITTAPGDYSAPVFDSGIDSSKLTQITIPGRTVNSGTTYHWRVRHRDNHGTWSNWSSETSFTTAAGGGGGGTNLTPLVYFALSILGLGLIIAMSMGFTSYSRKRRIAKELIEKEKSEIIGMIEEALKQDSGDQK